MGRRLLHTNQEHLKRGAWTAEEDRILANYINTHGETGWKSLPNKAGLNRCGKSCRLRWLNYLRPDIKRGNISADEDELIIRLHRLLGNRWALIAGRLPGRTDNEIKNYWNTHLSKKLAMGSSRTIDSTAHEPLGKDATVPGRERQSEFNEDDASKPCEVRCGSDNDEQVLNDTKSWTQLLEESMMDNPAEDTKVDDSNVSSKFNVSYPLHHCNLFSLSNNDFRSREDFSGQAGDIWLLHNNPNVPSHTFGDAKCLGIAEKYNILEGEETRLIELLPFEWEGHVDFTASYQVEYLDNLVDIPDQDLTY